MSKTNTNTWFFVYNQNNSGGFDVETDYVGSIVVIEAEDHEIANEAVQRVTNGGVYFDGCDGDWPSDCPCCGDRWYRQHGTYDVYETEKDALNDVTWGSYAVVYTLDEDGNYLAPRKVAL